jgi:hypothetical protein
MNETKHVYQWFWDCGRHGSLEGLFVATEGRIKEAEGKEAYFGEVLGKHSDVWVELESKHFSKLSSDENVVEFVKDHGPFGYNPLHYIGIAS